MHGRRVLRTFPPVTSTPALGAPGFPAWEAKRWLRWTCKCHEIQCGLASSSVNSRHPSMRDVPLSLCTSVTKPQLATPDETMLCTRNAAVRGKAIGGGMLCGEVLHGTYADGEHHDHLQQRECGAVLHGATSCQCRPLCSPGHRGRGRGRRSRPRCVCRGCDRPACGPRGP